MRKYLLVFIVTNLLFAQGNVMWQKDGSELPSGGTSWSTPLIMNGKIFWAGQDKGFVALDALTGNVIWTDTLNFYNGTYDSPVGYDGKIFISRNDYLNPASKSLLAINAENGSIIWQKNNFYTCNRSNKPIAIEPQHLGDYLYAASVDTLFCFNTDKGEVIWQKAGQYSNLSVDYHGLRLFAARSDSAKIEVISRVDGQISWSLTLPDAGVSTANLAYTNYMWKEYLVIAPANRQNAIFYCLDIAAQNILWSSADIGFVGNKAAPVIYQDKVVVGVEKTTQGVPQEVVAFSLLTGDVLWQNQARSEGSTNTPYVVALDGKAFYNASVNDTNAIVAADISSGSILWSTQPGFQNPWPLVWGSPLIYENRLYVSKDHEGIFCFDAETINGEWTTLGGNVHATNSFFSPLVEIEKENNELPEEFTLYQNYPNPFNPKTKIKFSISEAAHVELNIYNILGQLVTSLVNQEMSAGNYIVDFNASNLSSGIYFYTMKAGSQAFAKKMTLLK